MVLNFTIIFNSIFNKSAWYCSFFPSLRSLSIVFCQIYNTVLLQLKVFNVVISSCSWLVQFKACKALTNLFLNPYREWIEKTLPKPTLLKSEQALMHSILYSHAKVCKPLIYISFAYNDVPLSTAALRRCLLEFNTVLNVYNSAEYEVWDHVNNC